MTPSRKSEVETLLRMAEGDARAFEALARADNVPASRAGFMAQQAVEKTLKALLIAKGAEAPRSHDLVELLVLIRDSGVSAPAFEDDLDSLTQYSVNLRYNDEGGEPLTSEQIRRLYADIRDWAQSLINTL